MRLTDVLHTKVPEYCPCGQRISIAHRYCPHCGKKITLPVGLVSDCSAAPAELRVSIMQTSAAGVV